MEEGLILATVLVVLGWSPRWVPWLWRHRPRRDRPMTGEHCTACGAQLPEGGVWELVGRIEDYGDGGSACVATYCRRHRPERAVRV